MREVRRSTATAVTVVLGGTMTLFVFEFGWWGVLASIPCGIVWALMDYEEDK